MPGIEGMVAPLVDAPPPTPLRYGLLSVARVVDVPGGIDSARLRAAGYAYLIDHCGTQIHVDGQSCDANPVKVFEEGSELREGDPFALYTKKHCGSLGRSEAEMRAAALAAHTAGEQAALELAVWTALSASVPTIITPEAPGAGTALSALEYAAGASIHYQGVVHVPASAASALIYSGAARWDGTVWRTPQLHKISFGSGYVATSGPTPPADGFVWAFLTGQVDIRRGAATIPPLSQTFDRTANQWVAEVNRPYAFTWECPEVYAVQIPVAAPATTAAPAVPAP